MAHLIQRGSTYPSPLPTSFFIFYRFLDLPVQYAILSSRSLGAPLITALGGTPIPPSPTATPWVLGLSPQRSILLGMALGSCIKQSYWAGALCLEPFSHEFALSIGIFNTLSNSLNTLMFVNAATSVLSYPSVAGDENKLPLPTLVGAGLVVAGLGIEWISEVQRLRFKKDPKNKGKPYTGGLFGIARHINYTGYLLWRVGFALAGGGWGWGLAMAVLWAVYFVTGKGAIPGLDAYCAKRYKEEWAKYKKDVPYKLIPFIL